MESVHFQKKLTCSLLLFCFSFLPEHYYFGPHDLFFLTPMKPGGQCVVVYKMLLFFSPCSLFCI